jgi:hypothetical protein
MEAAFTAAETQLTVPDERVPIHDADNGTCGLSLKVGCGRYHRNVIRY